jgi:hypothetical protein
MFDPMDANLNSNDNHICLQGNGDATFASLHIEGLIQGDGYDQLFRPDAPFTPFDCDSFTAGPIVPPEMN